MVFVKKTGALFSFHPWKCEPTAVDALKHDFASNVIVAVAELVTLFTFPDADFLHVETDGRVLPKHKIQIYLCVFVRVLTQHPLEPEIKYNTLVITMGLARIATIVTATVVLLIVIVMVAVPYILLVRIMEYNQMYATVRTPRAKISEIYPHIKSGDLLMFVSASHLPVNSGISQTFFSHAAMLLREGDLVYTSEAQMGTEIMPNPNMAGTDYHMNKGAASAPMLTRIKFYTGNTYIMRISRALDPVRERNLKAAADHLHSIGYAYPTTRQLLARIVLGRKPNARHCFQHVAHLLDEVGLTPLIQDTPLAESGVYQVCQDVCGLANCPLPDGYYYEPPIEIIYDVGVLSFSDSRARPLAA